MTVRIVLFMASLLAAHAATVTVRTPSELGPAVRDLREGDTLRFAPGVYPGGHHVSGIARLTVEGLDPHDPPHFKGGGTAWQFSRCDGLTLRNLRISGQTGNGLNLDDGGERTKPVRGITIEGVEVTDIGPQGNHDAIKCSGLDALTISNCAIAGWGGQGIDLVGCHDVRIVDCRLSGKTGFSASAGIQTKGGSSNVVIERCTFRDASPRPLNIGGSTGLAYFRPPGVRHEAAQITVRDCVIEGSQCAAAFVGVDGAVFERNTIRYPTKWIFRILQETTAEGFAPCRNVIVRDNRFVFRRAQVQTDVNIGPNTAAGTFRFERNRWLAEDAPERSRPQLPVAESGGVWGVKE